jgi:hypothetical protein
MRLEGLGKLKKKIHLIGTRTRDLPVCSIVPQPTTLPRARQPIVTGSQSSQETIHYTEIKAQFWQAGFKLVAF